MMRKCVQSVAVALVAAGALSASAASLSFDAQSEAAIAALVAASDWSGAGQVGPPPTARFTEPGPITVNSGAATPLYRGPGSGSVDGLLFILSAYQNPANSTMQLTVGADTFTASPSSSFSGVFGSGISGIGNGLINGIRIGDSTHIGALLTGSDLASFLGNTTDAQIGTFAASLAGGVTGARVDVFGVSGGKLINVTPNSGGVGVNVPEPASILASVVAAAGLLAGIRRKLTA